MPKPKAVHLRHTLTKLRPRANHTNLRTRAPIAIATRSRPIQLLLGRHGAAELETANVVDRGGDAVDELVVDLGGLAGAVLAVVQRHGQGAGAGDGAGDEGRRQDDGGVLYFDVRAGVGVCGGVGVGI